MPTAITRTVYIPSWVTTYPGMALDPSWVLYDPWVTTPPRWTTTPPQWTTTFTEPAGDSVKPSTTAEASSGVEPRTARDGRR